MTMNANRMATLRKRMLVVDAQISGELDLGGYRKCSLLMGLLLKKAFLFFSAAMALLNGKTAKCVAKAL